MMLQTTTRRDVKTPEPLAISATDLAMKLGVSLRHIRRLDASGKLPEPIRLGNSIRWLIEEIEAWLQAGAPARTAWEAMKGVSNEGHHFYQGRFDKIHWLLVSSRRVHGNSMYRDVDR